MNSIRSQFGTRGLSLLLCLMLLVSVVVFGAARAVYAEESSGDTTTTGASDTTTTGEATGETTGEAEKPKIEFVLWNKLKKVDTKGWIMFGSAAVIAVALIIFLAKRSKDEKNASMQKVSTTLIIVQGALCVALSFVLSYLKIFSMPTGGSMTLASMLPLMVFANRHGLRWGLAAGVIYGMLQFFQKPEITHWVQVVLDYPLAFALIGLGGLTKGIRNLPFSVLIGGLARLSIHIISGAIFFGEYAFWGANMAEGVSFFQKIVPNVSVSAAYNGPYMLADIAICLVIALLPPFRSAIRKALKY